MKPLQSPLFWIVAAAAVAVLLVIGVGVIAAIKYARRNPPGFLDYVKNPILLKELEEENAVDESAIEEAQHWNDKQIETAVRRYVFEDGGPQDYRVLASLGPRTTTALLKLLGDESLRSKLLTGSDLPFASVCDLLTENPTAEAVPLLVPFLEAQSKEIREGTAELLGTIGADSVVAPVRKALQDSDEYVRSYALMGLERAGEANRLSDACRQELFPDVQRLLLEGKNCDHAGLLLEMNKDKATEFFLSDAILNPKAESLHHVLRELNERGIIVPRERLLVLIEQLEATSLEHPQHFRLAEALHCLGKHKNSDDRAILERFLSHSDQDVTKGAADGMLALHGLDGFLDRIWKAKGPASLTQPQRNYLAVVSLDDEVNNGGFSQYFFNSSGDDWQTALSGLEEMGSKERLAMFKEALAKFDKSSPSESRNQRMDQLAKIESGKDSVFDELNTRYFKYEEDLGVLMMRYVLRNAEAFR
ncbi:MAG: DUF4375 domain-containing protein [Pirellulaceae bacterium]